MTSPERIYISDLDGTLLDERGTLSERSRKGLLRLMKGGVAFTVASARSHCSIKSIFGDFPFELPIIEFNGAMLTDYESGEHLEINSLDEALGREVFDRILSHGLRPFVSSFNGEEDCLYFDELINSGMLWYEKRRRRARDPRLRQTRFLRETMSERVVSMTVMAQSEDQIRRLETELEEAYGSRLQLYSYENAYSKGSWWLTVHDEGASKHLAVQKLKDRLAPQTQVIALGDNFNDLEMLRYADRAIAVENAVPELLEIAHEVVGHHRTDSVVRFLEEQEISRGA